MTVDKRSVFAPSANFPSRAARQSKLVSGSGNSIEAEIDDLDRRVTALEQESESEAPADGSNGNRDSGPNAESLGGGQGRR